MASSSLIAETVLSVGEATTPISIAESGETLTLTFTSTQRGTASSQARLVVLDASGRSRATELINDTGTEEVTIKSIDGALSAFVECLSGSCVVSVASLSGIEGVLGGGQIETDDLATGILSVTAAGRAKMADGFLSADATGRAKVADSFVNTVKLADGVLSADAAGRAKVADSFFNDTTVVTAKFAAASIPANRVVASAPDITNAIADPGDAAAIPVTNSGHVALVSGGAETRTLAAPTNAGQMLLLFLDTDMGNVVVTVASAFDAAGNNTLTFDDAGDTILLVGITVGGTEAWRVVENVGVGASMV